MSTLRLRRAELGLTQTDVARLVGCSVALVSRIENGRRQPSVVMAGKFARAVRSDISELFPQFKVREIDATSSRG